MDADIQICEMVLLARRRVKINQHKFALMIGCSANHLNAIEGGKHTPSIKLLRKMADVLGSELVISFQKKK
jgi:DNA-binding XRE family transcriptional regulator